MKAKIIIAAIAVYLSIGLLFALYTWSQDLRTFSCGEDLIQHTYDFTTGTGSFENPDPERCTRRGFETHSIVTIPYFTVVWPVVIGGKLISEQYEPVVDTNTHDGTLGTLRGTIFLGEPCPARGDEPDVVCTGEPTHETFNLVRNFISNETWQQFGTNESGQFEITLPTGEYAIEYPDTRLGRQQRLVNVLPDEETEVTITFEEVHTYTNTTLGFSMLYPSSVYLIHEDDGLVQFSTLPPDDLKQQSSVGLGSSLSIRTSDTPLIEGGEEVELRGEQVYVADTINGAYAGEAHREYFYPEHNLSVSYVAIPPQDTFFTRMVLSIEFE